MSARGVSFATTSGLGYEYRRVLRAAREGRLHHSLAGWWVMPERGLLGPFLGQGWVEAAIFYGWLTEDGELTEAGRAALDA